MPYPIYTSNSNSKADVKWQTKFKDLLDFKIIHGHCKVPRDFDDNPSLGLWVMTQRRQYKNVTEGKPSSLTKKKVEALKAVGFVWTVKESSGVSWTKHYDDLVRFKIREGHCRVPQKFSENPSLGLWVNNQRRQYKNLAKCKPSSMTEERMKLLDHIGFIWNVNDLNDDIAWRGKYMELEQFKNREGHCRVPHKFEDNPTLGSWVKNQRRQFKNMKEGKPSIMTEDRMRALETIGFSWDINGQNDTLWIKNYEDLKKFMVLEGHCRVPRYFDKNPSLGLWVMTQRRQYKNMKEGKSSSMTGKRVQALDAIGFLWRVKHSNDESWIKKYEDLKKFKIREGHCKVPQKFVENPSLGLWVSYQRHLYKKFKEGKPSSMTQKRIELLDEIAFL